MASMRPFLNTNNLFIKEITAGVSKQAVVSSLQAFCARTQGLVVVPVDYDSGATMGMAYMNFNCKEDGGLWGRVWGPSFLQPIKDAAGHIQQMVTPMQQAQQLLQEQQTPATAAPEKWCW